MIDLSIFSNWVLTLHILVWELDAGKHTLLSQSTPSQDMSVGGQPPSKKGSIFGM